LEESFGQNSRVMKKGKGGGKDGGNMSLGTVTRVPELNTDKRGKERLEKAITVKGKR